MKISRDPDTNFPGNGKSQNPEFPGKFPVPPSREETLIPSNASGLEHSCPWPREGLSLATRGSVLGKAILGLVFFFFSVLDLGLEPCVLDSTSDTYNKSIIFMLVVSKYSSNNIPTANKFKLNSDTQW